MYNSNFISHIIKTINDNRHDYIGKIYAPSEENKALNIVIKNIRVSSNGTDGQKLVVVRAHVMLNKKKSDVVINSAGYIGDFFPKCKYGKVLDPMTNKGKHCFKKYGLFRKIKKVKSLSMRIHSADGSVNIIDLKRLK